MRQLITGEQGHKTATDSLEPLDQQISILLNSFADDKSGDKPPFWGESNPNSSITIQHQYLFKRAQMTFLFVNKTPQFIQLTLGHMQVVKQVGRHRTAVASRLIQSGTYGILVNPDYPSCAPQRISFSQSAHGNRENSLLSMKTEVGCPMPGGESTLTHIAQQPGNRSIPSTTHQMTAKPR